MLSNIYTNWEIFENTTGFFSKKKNKY